MPQGNKKPSQPVKTNLVAGTFKKGGKVRKMAEGGDPMGSEERDRLTAEAMRQANNPPEVALDFSQDPSFQAGPQASVNDYASEERLNTDQRRENQSDYYNQGNVDSYSRPMSIEFPFDASRQRIEPPSRVNDLPPMLGRVDETGRGYGSYLPASKANPFMPQFYKAGGKVARSKRMADGGSSSAQDKYMLKDPKAVSDKASQELEEALNPLSMAKELYGKAKNYLMPKGSVTESERKSLGDTTKPKSVTKTKESVTVTPAKKRGGMVKC